MIKKQIFPRLELGTKANFNFPISKFILGILILISTVVLFPATAKAATLYLDPARQTIGPNDEIIVKVKIGVGSDECINTAQIGITFPNDVLEFKDFNSADSFLSLWLKKPDQGSLAQINADGKIIFTGGIPGGYCGVIPGDTGESNILGELIFVPKKPIIFHQAKLDFSPETLAYLNDGNGTQAEINTQGAELSINENAASSSNVWAQEITDDKIPPEAFTIEINSSPRIADGKYFLVFSTVDKQTGVDHYEVLESKVAGLQPKTESAFEKFIDKVFNVKGPLPPAWTTVSSPYILRDQSLQSVIRVKAVDRAGNERVVEYNNAALQTLKNPQHFNWRLIGIICGVVIIIFVGVPLVVFLKRKMRRKKDF
jgi:hypothetical protein